MRKLIQKGLKTRTFLRESVGYKPDINNCQPSARMNHADWLNFNGSGSNFVQNGFNAFANLFYRL